MRKAPVEGSGEEDERESSLWKAEMEPQTLHARIDIPSRSQPMERSVGKDEESRMSIEIVEVCTASLYKCVVVKEKQENSQHATGFRPPVPQCWSMNPPISIQERQLIPQKGNMCVKQRRKNGLGLGLDLLRNHCRLRLYHTGE
jgi:hypothetical protein